MDLEEVKSCVRALASSSPLSCTLNSLLYDFKEFTGFDLPLFGHQNPLSFLRSLKDVVQLSGDSHNPRVIVVESEKSSHIISLIDRQRKNKKKKNQSPSFKLKEGGNPCQRLDNLDKAGRSGRMSPDHSEHEKSMNEKTKRSFSTAHSPENCFNRSHNSKASEEKSVARAHRSERKAVLSGGAHLTPDIQPMNEMLCEEAGSSKEIMTQKGRSCYFEEFSDGEEHLKGHPMNEGSTNPTVAQNDLINEGIRQKLKDLIKDHPDGIWCCDLPKLFLRKYNFGLDYREFGFTSLILMLSELPEVFRCLRPGNEDWILFDASAPPSLKEKEIMDLKAKTDVTMVLENVKKLLAAKAKHSITGVEMSKIPELYKEMFGISLNVPELGYKDLRSLLETWEGSVFNIYKVGGILFCDQAIFPIDNARVRGAHALPPITAEDDLFPEIFPKDVVRYDENLSRMDLFTLLEERQIIPVRVGEVWSPKKFFIHFRKFRQSFSAFRDEMQTFYNGQVGKFKMPSATIVPGQMCVALYSPLHGSPDEWYRGRIVKVVRDSITVNFVDLGIVTRVKKSKLRFLHRRFTNFPVQAYQARLAGIEPLDGRKFWPIPVTMRFLDLVHVIELNAEIVRLDHEKRVIEVILIDNTTETKMIINKQLVDENLAKRIRAFTNPENEDPRADTSNSSDSEASKDQSSNCLEGAENLGTVAEVLPPVTTEVENAMMEIDEFIDSLCLLDEDVLSILVPEDLLAGIQSINAMAIFKIPTLYHQEEETMFQISLLALEIFSKDKDIKTLSLEDPVFGMRLARDMAEIFIKSQSSDKPLEHYGFHSFLPNELTDFSILNDPDLNFPMAFSPTESIETDETGDQNLPPENM